MRLAVVDASVVVQMYFEEDHSAEAEWLFRQNKVLVAPDMIWPECANAIWKRHRRGNLSKADATDIADRVMRLPLRIHASVDLIQDALKLAIEFDRTVYDSLYVALAVETESTMVTADKRLVNALAGSPLEKYVQWLGDLKS